MDSLAEFRDWAHLPPEIIDLISEKAKYIVDHLRFRAVCSTWRSASLPNPRHLPPQLPWLMLPYNGYLWTAKNGTRFFYDVWESRMREIHLPETSGATCCASYRGWLLVVSYKGRQISLLNPLTRSEIELPPFSTWFGSYMIHFGKSKMTFSADVTDPNCLITVFLEDNGVISCQVGDQSWKMYYPTTEGLADATCYNGRLYLLYQGNMLIIECNQPQHKGVPEPESKVILEPELAAVKKRFVEGKSGVYVVGLHPEGKFLLYQFQEQQMKLEKITTDSSDSTVIFYGDNYPCLALSSDD